MLVVSGGECGAIEVGESKEFIDVDPSGQRVIVTEIEFGFFVRHSQSFDKAGAPVNTRQAASSIFETAVNDFKIEGFTRF